MNKKENSSKYLSAMFENVSIIVLHFQKSLKPLAIHGFCVLLQRHKATVFTKDVKIKLESKAFHLFGGSPKVNSFWLEQYTCCCCSSNRRATESHCHSLKPLYPTPGSPTNFCRKSLSELTWTKLEALWWRIYLLFVSTWVPGCAPRATEHQWKDKRGCGGGCCCLLPPNWFRE